MTPKGQIYMYGETLYLYVPDNPYYVHTYFLVENEAILGKVTCHFYWLITDCPACLDGN